MSKPKDIKLPQELPDLPVDREQGLSNSFEDPGIAEVFSGFQLDSGEGAKGIVQEAAEAVEELVLDANSVPEGLDLSDPALHPEMPVATGLDVAAEANQIFSMELAGESSLSGAKAEMAAQLFELVATAGTFDHLVERLLAAIQKALGAQAASVLELDHRTSEFFFRASLGGGDPEKVKAFRVPATKGIVGHVAESRQPLLLKSVESDARHLRAISMSTGFETNTCLAAPIILDNQVYGVIELFNKNSGESFDEKDQQVLEDAVRMASKVLEVRFLVNELLRRAG